MGSCKSVSPGNGRHHSVWLPGRTQPRLGLLPPSELPAPTALFTTQGGKNLSTRSEPLISLLGCLGSSDVIIIPTKALVSVRLISPTAADTIIKAPEFLCSKSGTDEAHKVCLGGKTEHRIVFSHLLSSPSCFLPSTDQGEAAGMSHMQLETDPYLQGCEGGSHMLTGQPEKPCDEAGAMPRGGCWLLPRDLTRWHLPWHIPQPLAPSLGGAET